MTAPYRNHTVCNCKDRLFAMHAQTLRWSHQLGGWYFTDAPTRSTKYPAPIDNKGFPYIHTICDFCGCVLPGVVFKDDTPLAQGDGNPEE